VTIEDESPNDKCLQFDVEVSVAKHQAPFATATGVGSQVHRDLLATTSAPDAAGVSGVPFAAGVSGVPFAAGVSGAPFAAGVSGAPFAAGVSGTHFAATVVENRTSSSVPNTLFDKVSIRNPKHLMRLIKSQTRTTPYPLPQPFDTAYQLAKKKKKEQMRTKANASSTGFAGYLEDPHGKQRPPISPPRSVADGCSSAAASTAAVSAVNVKIQNRLKAIEALRFGAGSSASPLSMPPRSANPSPQLAFAGSPHSNASSWGSGVVEPATTSFGSDISSPSNVSLVHQFGSDIGSPSSNVSLGHQDQLGRLGHQGDSMIFTPVAVAAAPADPLRMPNFLQSVDGDGLFTRTTQMLSSAFEPYHPAVWNPPGDLTDPLFLDF